MDEQGFNWLLGMLFNQKIGWVLFAVLIVLMSYRLYKLEVLIDTMQASFQKLHTWTTEQSDNDRDPYSNLETKIRKLCIRQIQPLSDKINEVEIKVNSKV